jgi:hypothetical protein
MVQQVLHEKPAPCLLFLLLRGNRGATAEELIQWL